MASRSMMPKSWSIWNTGVPARLCSAATSSYCRSSIKPCSLISDSSGLEISSDIQIDSGLAGTARVDTDSLGQLEFLQLGLDGNRILRLGNNFFAGDHSGQIFLDEKSIQCHHAPLGAGLNVRLNSEGLVVADQSGDG